ncbi:hypothetical protein AB1Y20_006217 [Prymnesium parvum]|uniref:Uncharacterized protein n=1 Tax=Prymnesium parvum TaxID=97485 RepID=A0AB34J5B7_PRYPA
MVAVVTLLVVSIAEDALTFDQSRGFHLAPSHLFSNVASGIAARQAWSDNLSAEVSAFLDTPGALNSHRILVFLTIEPASLNHVSPSPAPLAPASQSAPWLSPHLIPAPLSVASMRLSAYLCVAESRATRMPSDMSTPRNAPGVLDPEQFKKERDPIVLHTNRRFDVLGPVGPHCIKLEAYGREKHASILPLSNQHVYFFRLVRASIEGFEYQVLRAVLGSHHLATGTSKATEALSLWPTQIAMELHFQTQMRELPFHGRLVSVGEIALFMDFLWRQGSTELPLSLLERARKVA